MAIRVEKMAPALCADAMTPKKSPCHAMTDWYSPQRHAMATGRGAWGAGAMTCLPQGHDPPSQRHAMTA